MRIGKTLMNNSRKKNNSTTDNLEKALAEKEILLEEIQHRVKNNYQVISSLISLQMNTINDPKSLEVLTKLNNRIISISMIQEKLYQTEHLSGIDFEKYISDLVHTLIDAYSVSSKQVEVVMDIENNCFFDIEKMTPFALILNELISNAMKHAFPGDRKGTIRISATAEEENCSVIISDDGIGVNVAVEELKRESLGLRLVYSLINQLQGTIHFESKLGSGVMYKIKFSIIDDKSHF
ncbi:MAG: sensor histidine kinase [Chlorobi bacterium]|nr:sensor histidine kinase [Chlorobiota bacterium]